ncbi:MAG: hypothetical protein AB7G93_18040 [Bdellovibrionales bacterium]
MALWLHFVHRMHCTSHQELRDRPRLICVLITCLTIIVTVPAQARCIDWLNGLAGPFAQMKEVLQRYTRKLTRIPKGEPPKHLVHYARARRLARNFGLRLNDLDLDPDPAPGGEQVAVLYARMGQQMNAEGKNPLVFLKQEAARIVGLRDYIAELEARIKHQGFEVTWNESGETSSRRFSTKIEIGVNRCLQSEAIAACILSIEHELAHEPQEWILESRRVTMGEFVDRYLPAIIKDELRVRLKERAIYNKLRSLGLRVTPLALTELTRELWSAQDNGATTTELLELVAQDYRLDVVQQLASYWIIEYYESDLRGIVEIVRSSDESQLEARLRDFMASSVRYQRLDADQRPLYWNDLFDGAAAELVSSSALTGRLAKVKNLIK